MKRLMTSGLLVVSVFWVWASMLQIFPMVLASSGEAVAIIYAVAGFVTGGLFIAKGANSINEWVAELHRDRLGCQEQG